MGFLTSLFGGETNYLTMILALGIVIVLIVLAVWLIKVLGQATRTVGRGRNRRLAVIDTIAIDQKRQALIIRRDNVEHLIVTGGPNDLVVESGFEAPIQATAPRPQRRLFAGSDKVANSDASDAHGTEGAGTGVSRLRALGGNGTSKSLRHTGLLRTVDDDNAELASGNAHNHAPAEADSDTNGSLDTESGIEDATQDPRNSDFAAKGKSKR